VIKMCKLSVIIPVHNRRELTRRCLLCLQKQMYSNFNTIVIDDGSTDGTSEMIKKDFPEVILLHGDGNLWWTGATNLGIKYALEKGTDLILTLNDDVIVKENYLENFITAHKEQPHALIGSIELSQEEPPRLLYAGIISHNSWTVKYIKRGKLLTPYLNTFTGLLHSYSLPGRGVLIPRTVFDATGLFDEKHFPHYIADQDFSLGAKKAGFNVLIHTENPVFSPYEPNRTGGENQSIPSFLKSFFTPYSCNYLPILLRYNYRHCPHKGYFPIYIIINLIRIIGSFIKRKLNK